ncbi:33K [Simian adenovirus 18]|uniref:33K n=1 Tax=Simian adenovirus 18 TaxID=909210 RepID=H8PG08_9ADEN|nr:33K [Simian adenovirus 18]AFD10574.1 33K [Simian adenovirus 18]
MPPKGNKQAIAQRRAKKQQELQEQWDEESWDSQAEEVSDEEEDMESWDSLDEEEEAEELEDEPLEEEEPSSAAAPSASKEAARSRPAPKQQKQQQPPPSPPTPPPGSLKASRRWDAVSIAGSPKAPVAPTRQKARPPRKTSRQTVSSAIATRQDSAATQELRKRIFPTLYAIFQQSRGQQLELKVKNRSLRSLTRSCLYHRREDQLQRTLEDAEALFNKYCSVSLKD